MRALALTLMLPLTAFAQTSGEKVKKETAEAVDASKQYLNEKKEDFEARMDARLKEARAKTKAFKEDKQAQLEKGAKERLAELEKAEKDAAARLAQVKKAGGNAWQSLKAGVEQAVDELDKGINGPK